MIKKILSLVLAVGLAVVLVGCGNRTMKKPKPPKLPTVTPQFTPWKTPTGK